ALIAATSARTTVRPTARSRRNVASASTSGSSGTAPAYDGGTCQSLITSGPAWAPGTRPSELIARELDPGRAVAAVAVRVLGEVLLVVALGVEELAERLDLGGHGAVAELSEFAGERLRRLLGDRLLLIIGVVDARPVLSADVVALAHPLRRVVHLEEGRHQ